MAESDKVLGIVWLGVIIILNGVSVYELIRRQRFYRERKSPLFYCYIFVVLGALALIADGVGGVLLDTIPVCFELALAFLFTAYSLPVYSWVMIIFQVKFLRSNWYLVPKYIYIAINVAILISALVSGLYPSAVNYLIFVISLLLSIGYITAFWVLKSYSTNALSRKLGVLSRIANRVVGMNAFVLVIYIIIMFPFPEHIVLWIDAHKIYLVRAEIISEIIVLMYNLRKMSINPSSLKNLNPSVEHIEMSSVTSSPSMLDTSPLDTCEVEMSDSPPFTSHSPSLSLATSAENAVTVDAILTNVELKRSSSHHRPISRSSSDLNLRFSNSMRNLTPVETLGDPQASLPSTIPPSPPNKDPTTYFQSYTFPSSNLESSMFTSQQTFTNASAFNMSMTHTNVDSPEVSQVFPSSNNPSALSTSQDCSALSFSSTPPPNPTRVSLSISSPNIFAQRPLTTRASITRSSLSLSTRFQTTSGTNLALPVHTPSSIQHL